MPTDPVDLGTLVPIPRPSDVNTADEKAVEEY